MDAVGQLTGGIAHDFNNLMQMVIGNLSVVVRVVPEEQADGLRGSSRKRRSARHAARHFHPAIAGIRAAAAALPPNPSI